MTYAQLLHNKNFVWAADSTVQGLTVHYSSGSWTDKNLEKVRQRLGEQYKAVMAFAGVPSYKAQIHLFVVESRAQMKLLVGHETNGSAFYSENSITGIASEKGNSIFSHHEMFHIVGMNSWGIPAIWLNEGMAVYADGRWHGHELYALTKYLVDHGRYVSLEKMTRHFRDVDDLLSYPLMGSFVKYLDETYGRAAVLRIWKEKPKNLKRITGKPLRQLEQDWLEKIKSVPSADITY